MTAKSLILSLLPLLIAYATAAGVVEHTVVVITPKPEYVTVTVAPEIVTDDVTTTISTTIFQAITTSITTAKGSEITTIQTVSAPPVTQYFSYTTTQQTTSYNPSFSNLLTLPASTTAQVPTIETSSAGAQSTSSVIPPIQEQSTTLAPTISSTLLTVTSSSLLAVSTSTSLSSVSVPPQSFSSVSSPVSSPSPTAAPPSGNYYPNGNIFGAIDTADVPSMFPREDLDISVPNGLVFNGKPVQTNKFYANLFLGDQHDPVYIQPYSVWWSNDSTYYGLGISHTNFSQRIFGPDPNANPVVFYINPVGIMSMVLSAEEFTADNMNLGIQDSDALSVTATLGTERGTITFPLVMGMGLITGEYSGLTPLLFSQIGFNSVTFRQEKIAANIQKYTVQLFNGDQWVIYTSLPQGQSFSSSFQLEVTDNFHIRANSQLDGLVVQVGVVPQGAEDDFDSVAGAYPVGASIDASVTDDVGTYDITYDIKGSSSSGDIWIWAYPHLVESFTSAMTHVTDFTIDSLTKGVMTGVIGTKLEMSEQLYTSMQYLPWTSNSTFTGPTYSADALSLIAQVAKSEMAENVMQQVNLSSTYFAAKAYDKFAYILLVAKDILRDDSITQSFLKTLEDAFTLFTTNSQQIPLMYDTLFKGITSSGAQNGGSPMTDFGSPYYNDHHFHYGYLVHTAAIVGYVDSAFGGTWVEDNKDWVNSLIREVANPSKDDTLFPVYRMFDWFSGHSWARGLFVAVDGKDEESSSEDYNFAYGMKLWGKVIGDFQMEARGDLQLAIMKRSLHLYFLMENDNTIQPSNFIANKVPGIMFENKLDHTTYFGNKLQYIQGIQMIPITPASGLIRSPTFVQQEWEEKLVAIIDSLDGGWAGILRSNQALFDPVGAYNWFSQSDFQQAWLDGGASRTWYLALSAGLGGSPA